MNKTKQNKFSSVPVLNERCCYCDLWNKDPELLRSQGVPEGFCGICERCGQPGHLRNHPAPVAYTSAWCDRCYRILFWTWPFRLPIGWVMLFVIVLLLSILLPLLGRLF